MSAAEESTVPVSQKLPAAPSFQEYIVTLFTEARYELILAVIVVLVSLVPILFLLKKLKKRRHVLFMGLSDSGKTLLFSRLLYHKFKQTHTSITENLGDFESDYGSLHIVDIPGHERLRVKFFDQYKSFARGIVYIIDSSTLQKNVSDVAEFLHTLLTDASILSTNPKILILCNKQDDISAKGSTVIRKLLEKEMTTLQMTKASQLDAVDATKKKNIILGKLGTDFEFSCLSYKIQFAECSAYNKDDEKQADIEQLIKWLQTL